MVLTPPFRLEPVGCGNTLSARLKSYQIPPMPSSVGRLLFALSCGFGDTIHGRYRALWRLCVAQIGKRGVLPPDEIKAGHCHPPKACATG